ncbi:Rac/Rho-like_protein [Hexamita inflata]|uniref:Rac/Rho-like_protein n=1 Tax=Hexamita inflata TaxID=28002 RepID=A0ABP1I8R6_9EUKA
MKCILVGDRTVGKSSLATLLQTHRFFKDNVPTVHDIVKQTIIHNSQTIQFDLWDSSNSNVEDIVRPILFRNVDVILVCYAVDNKTSFQNTVSKWIPENDLYRTLRSFWSVSRAIQNLKMIR